ncbi:NP_1176A family transcription regulator [Natronomonas pharaonis DSM 2160]|uniref:NP_1176A family transcription regulator n=1 Tax=Natronomonas pharaonis (strain ATCC 35678 / DSM 2160 / CIP 103997 / JCM 8858 / NBRC 14720 / NCIMB 2260 / Gabara) TaxID=348780 RepID=A0A1U7EX23_NATPD|nr:helix-turn-helix domain-containing protein [Natronomonas pharaonis]CAI49654.1 NP_1176A family transcription regulator [Natronomonas pharaonis DSM 2160]
MSDHDAAVEPLPPSAKLVYKTLEYEGPMSQSQLADASLLPQRTVRHALRKLDAAGVVEESVCLMDARKSTYELREPESSDPDTVTA